MNEKNAILNFIGQMYGQMKEIDTNIASVGSSAKFGGRSAELEKTFKQLATSPLEAAYVPPTEMSPVETMPMQMQPQMQPAVQQLPLYQPPQTDQLEFTFKDDANSILKDIYNVLFDIRKLLTEHTKAIKTIETAPAVKKPKKITFADCSLCGGKPKGEQTQDTLYQYTCQTCGNVSKGVNETQAKVAWNTENVQV